MHERLINVLLRLRQIIPPPATLICQQAKSNQLLCCAKSQSEGKEINCQVANFNAKSAQHIDRAGIYTKDQVYDYTPSDLIRALR